MSCRQNYKNYSRHPNRGGYSSSGAHNTMDIQDEFFKMAQAMTDDCSAVINPTTANTTLIEKVSLYANHLYTKEANNEALNAAVHNLRVYIKISRQTLPPSRNQVTPVMPVPPTRDGVE